MWLKALQIKDKADIRYMVDFFLPYAHCPICWKASTSKECEEGNESHEKVFQAATSTSNDSNCNVFQTKSFILTVDENQSLSLGSKPQNYK